MEQPTSQTLSGAKESWRILKRQLNGLAHNSLARTGHWVTLNHTAPESATTVCSEEKEPQMSSEQQQYDHEIQNHITNIMCPLPPNLENIALPTLVKPSVYLAQVPLSAPCHHSNDSPEFNVYQISLYLTIFILYITLCRGVNWTLSLLSAFPETFCIQLTTYSVVLHLFKDHINGVILYISICHFLF